MRLTVTAVGSDPDGRATAFKLEELPFVGELEFLSAPTAEEAARLMIQRGPKTLYVGRAGKNVFAICGHGRKIAGAVRRFRPNWFQNGDRIVLVWLNESLHEMLHRAVAAAPKAVAA